MQARSTVVPSCEVVRIEREKGEGTGEREREVVTSLRKNEKMIRGLRRTEARYAQVFPKSGRFPPPFLFLPSLLPLSSRRERTSTSTQAPPNKLLRDESAAGGGRVAIVFNESKVVVTVTTEP